MMNNLLTAVVGRTELARLQLSQPSMLVEDLDHIVHAADRAAALTERTVRQLAAPGVATELTVPPVTMQVRIEPGEFERILVNLVVNARDAMPAGPRRTTEYGWGSVYDPGHVRDDRIVSLETLIFSVPKSALVWAGMSETENPKDAAAVVADVVKAAAKEMKKQGLTRRSK